MAVRTRLISFIWGFAEATFFFIVPDVWLSRIALTNPKEAYISIFYAIWGALFGGVLMYYMGAYAYEGSQEFLNYIPAISDQMITNVENTDIEADLFNIMIGGMFSGVPYKVYAVWTGHLSTPLVLFILVSICARMARFLSVTALTHIIAKALKTKITAAHISRIHIGLWVLFYAFYFSVMGF